MYSPTKNIFKYGTQFDEHIRMNEISKELLQYLKHNDKQIFDICDKIKTDSDTFFTNKDDRDKYLCILYRHIINDILIK